MKKKNRWKKVLQPGLNKGHWTDHEDNIVRETVGNSEAEATVGTDTIAPRKNAMPTS